MNTNIENKQNHPGYRFAVLILMVLIAGFSQGMLLPLLAIMLEQAGTSSSLNGLNAAALYIGILLASPFIEKPVRKYGYKPVITIGLILIIFSLFLFPFWQVFWFWFILRMIVGIGDNMVHFATQVWITSTSPVHKRGRNISLYGLAFSLGFSAGPFMTRLLAINEYFPFIIAALFSLVSYGFVLFLKNEWPENDLETAKQTGTWGRYKQVIKLAWFALLPGFCYGFLEASIHGNYPVYALRSGFTIEWVSILLPAFVIGGLITQLPLGLLSDKWGRKKILLTVTFLGSLSFFSMIFVEQSHLLLLFIFTIAGALVGSLYSLGVMYLADLLPRNLLPTGNVMTAVSFGLGSILGPLTGGILIDVMERGSIYFAVGGILFIVFILGVVFKEKAPANVKKAATA
ncbi:MFS transporter [Alkalihalobacterium chitinilyticum]|uniref:MFS transporter n=1 Tax=Alkalihalobacterium chitinilyticum TaxID=2980103 RepID=A0ABT5VIK9_9BACI|nr:MFS transporter [Alkalihalobacterium chitinilyticum]MDE5415294.1 MFS transporter [Alkalihalobacterium chitinilyticum]